MTSRSKSPTYKEEFAAGAAVAAAAPAAGAGAAGASGVATAVEAIVERWGVVKLGLRGSETS